MSSCSHIISASSTNDRCLPLQVLPGTRPDTWPQDAGLTEAMSRELEGLWDALSACIGKIEQGLGKQAVPQIEASAAAKILPPGAAQVQSLILAFLLKAARAPHLAWQSMGCAADA